MTNEEAIPRIREHKIIHKMGEPRAIYISEALDMALEALEQEPCEDVFKERPIGHWRPVYQGDEIIDYRCSECEFGHTFGKGTFRMNYCPNCGAKMVESQESEERNDS